MLDENLPIFYVRPPQDKDKRDLTVFLTQSGLPPQPSYILRHPDPRSADSKNRYAAGLYDSFNASILYGEVLVIPAWTQPTLSSDEIRANNGITPPPQPILPSEVTIQLYNPDMQVPIRKHDGSWSSSSYWIFEIPQQTFRQPSTSALDRTQSDPTALDIMPKIEFRWKRDSKLSKDMICYLAGRSRNPDGSKKKHREPDIPIAFCKQKVGLELTIYEPNVSRVDIEDLKGLEVVLLLSAITIKDVFFASNLEKAFNITPLQIPPMPSVLGRPTSTTPTPSNGAPQPARLPPTDPRSQWEIDTQTAQLMAAVKLEDEREARNRAAEKRARDVAEERRVREMLADEDRASRARDEAVAKETERLKKLYGGENGGVYQSGLQTGGPAYLNVNGSGNSNGKAEEQNGKLKQKKSGWFGLRGGGEEER